MSSMWAFSFLGCMGPVIVLGLAAVCIRTIWLALMPPSKVSAEPSCGKCGYSVTGLTVPECPECGVDLRIAGINTRALAMRHRGGLGGAILAWTILMGGGGFILLTFIGVFYSRMAVQSATVTPQTWATPMYPNSKTYASVTIVQSMTTGGPGSSRPVKLDLALSDGSTWQMTVNGGTRTCTITDPAGQSAGPALPYSPGSTAAFFKAAGLDPTDPKVNAEAAELRTVVDVVLLSPYIQPSQMNLTEFAAASTTFGGGAAMMPVARAPFDEMGGLLIVVGAPITWLLVYGTGIWLIVRRRRRLLARFGR